MPHAAERDDSPCWCLSIFNLIGFVFSFSANGGGKAKEGSKELDYFLYNGQFNKDRKENEL